MDLARYVDALNGRLLFAIPKKGRLHDKCLELLAGADIHSNHNMALVFLPASDIPSFVGKGNDVIKESQMQQHVTEVLPLNFGKCALQVQVPEAGPVQSVEQLTGKRVVTSFEVLSGEYFGRLDDQLGLVGDKKTRIEYVGGSVEAACALGLADGIESGDTMRAAGLHAIATLLQTEAVLIKSSTPKHESLDPLIKLITARIAGVVAAGKYVVCEYNITRAKLHDATTIRPAADEAWVAVSSMVEKKRIADVMDELVKMGPRHTHLQSRQLQSIGAGPWSRTLSAARTVDLVFIAYILLMKC
ncbi:ATP phosphoribosyltransferase [Fomitopsis serialis]|uniref:ATP phosphoribosyltransferase n=1 Tax=Fomitopsis serialis TaxID=139415 RepID=UPI002007AB5E|nr:ATP phosphoribosyltransferase [Neoantrodia serialis]KAH9919328.1 ATP phosphoribosyltransferase [Neoantrodia serialis]